MVALERSAPYTPWPAGRANAYAAEIERVATGVFGNTAKTAAPLFKVSRTSNLSVLNATDTTIPWQSAPQDPDSMWDPANPTRINVRTPGVWLLQSQSRLLYANTTGIRGAYISKNTTTGQTNILAGVEVSPTPSWAGDIATLTAVVPLLTTDVIYFRLYHSAGVTLTADWQLYGGTSLAGVWLGPS